MSSTVPYIGSKISLVSNSDIRYEGILYTINTQESTIALQSVRCCGTEGRKVPEIPPSSEIYDFIIFRGQDIKDLTVLESANPALSAQLNDPAIMSVNQRPPGSGAGKGTSGGKGAVASASPGGYSSGAAGYGSKGASSGYGSGGKGGWSSPGSASTGNAAKGAVGGGYGAGGKGSAVQSSAGASWSAAGWSSGWGKGDTRGSTDRQQYRTSSGGVGGGYGGWSDSGYGAGSGTGGKSTGGKSSGKGADSGTTKGGKSTTKGGGKDSGKTSSKGGEKGSGKTRSKGAGKSSGGDRERGQGGGRRGGSTGGAETAGGTPVGELLPQVNEAEKSKYTEEFDYEGENRKFDKVLKDVEGEVDEKLKPLSGYDKGKSFFDNISCEATERAGDAERPKVDRNKARQNDRETFGDTRRPPRPTAGRRGKGGGGRHGSQRGGYRS